MLPKFATFTHATPNNGDRGRLAELAACFAEDGTLEFHGGKGTGPEGSLNKLVSVR